MNVVQATREFEKWLGGHTTVVRIDLASKHEKMAEDSFSFLRGTFYRWAQTWPDLCPDLARAPKILAVGDLHVGSFGTWRDVAGRLIWGVDDFDESYALPYTSDLVRLATGAHLAAAENHLRISLKEACDVILEGYTESLKAWGRPFVLAERHKWLRSIALRQLPEPSSFWKKLDRLPAVKRSVPPSATKALESRLPEPGLPYRVVRRVAGVASLGHQRFVAIAEWRGGRIALEAKALVRSSCEWAGNRNRQNGICYQDILKRAVRCPDPFVQTEGDWIVRCLAPDTATIEIESISGKGPEDRLLHAMGWEAANIHLGTKRVNRAIGKDLRGRPAGWLRSAARDMSKAVARDWKRWKNDRPN